MNQNISKLLLAAAVAGCTVQVYAGPETKPSKKSIKYIDQANMDPGVKPGDKIVSSGLDHLVEGTIIKPEVVKSNPELTMAATPK